MMDPPFDVLANVRRLIRLLRESGGGTIGRVASQSNTRRWEGSLCVSEEDMSLLFILSHLVFNTEAGETAPHLVYSF
jgi:hypothetical protein